MQNNSQNDVQHLATGRIFATMSSGHKYVCMEIRKKWWYVFRTCEIAGQKTHASRVAIDFMLILPSSTAATHKGV